MQDLTANGGHSWDNRVIQLQILPSSPLHSDKYFFVTIQRQVSPEFLFCKVKKKADSDDVLVTQIHFHFIVTKTETTKSYIFLK